MGSNVDSMVCPVSVFLIAFHLMVLADTDDHGLCSLFHLEMQNGNILIFIIFLHLLLEIKTLSSNIWPGRAL